MTEPGHWDNPTVKTVLEKRYLLKDDQGVVVETPKEMFKRVARAVAEAERMFGCTTSLSGYTFGEWAEKFFDMMYNLDFLPNSPTLMNAGTEIGQLSACFVLPLEDSIEDIWDTAKKMAIIFKSGGGVGMSFSKLRPKGDMVMSTKGQSSGPISFMQVFDTGAEVVKQGGRRRGALMGCLRVDHPDIMDFIHVKDDLTKFTNFNTSVLATDKFMEQVQHPTEDGAYWTINPHTGEKVDCEPATGVFNCLVHQAWKTGEPGLIFIDKMNAANPTPEIGQIESTNPCLTKHAMISTSEGEKQISELIGVPFTAMVFGSGYKCEGFFKTGERKVVSVCLRDRMSLTATPDHKVLRVCTSHYRCGMPLGWVPISDLSFGDYILSENIVDCLSPYYSLVDHIDDRHGVMPVYDVKVPGINAFIANGIVVHNCGEQPLLPNESCNLGSINLANMVTYDGNQDADKLVKTVHLAVRFLDNVIEVNKYPLPEIREMTLANRKIGLGVMGWAEYLIKRELKYDSKKAIEEAANTMGLIQNAALHASCGLAKERGAFSNCEDSVCLIRNATRTTIAPTGSISMIAGVTGGIEPIFAVKMKRQNILDKDEFEVSHPLWVHYPHELFCTSHEVALEWHVRMQAAFQKYTDNAVSKTVNLSHDATEDDVRKIFSLAYDLGCKGITVYRDGCRENQPMTKQMVGLGRAGTNIEESPTPVEEAESQPTKYHKPRSRGTVLEGRTYKVKTGCGNIFITITRDEEGRPIELFAKHGKAGVCSQVQC